MRDSFSKKILEAVKINPKTYVLSGDHGYALFDLIRREKPDHFINAGVAEQNMVGVAAGLSKTGFFPVVYGLSAFIPVRVLEQIKIDFCYENLPGVFVGDGAGVVYSHLGASHQSTEDVASLRSIPNLTIFSPADKYEFEKAFDVAVELKSPVYLRLGKADLGNVHEGPIKNIFKPLPVRKNNGDIAFIGTGSMVKTALDLANSISLSIKADVFSLPCLKPVEPQELVTMFRDYKRVFTFEEHSVYGGLGSIISEAFANEVVRPTIKIFGIKDKFSKFCGSYTYLMKEHELDVESLRRHFL